MEHVIKSQILMSSHHSLWWIVLPDKLSHCAACFPGKFANNI